MVWSGDRELILAGLRREYPLMTMVFSLEAACFYGMGDEEIVKAVKKLDEVEDFSVFCGNMFSSWLTAAKHVLGIKEFHGDDSFITGMIADNFSFIKKRKVA